MKCPVVIGSLSSKQNRMLKHRFITTSTPVRTQSGSLCEVQAEQSMLCVHRLRKLTHSSFTAHNSRPCPQQLGSPRILCPLPLALFLIVCWPMEHPSREPTLSESLTASHLSAFSVLSWLFCHLTLPWAFCYLSALSDYKILRVRCAIFPPKPVWPCSLRDVGPTDPCLQTCFLTGTCPVSRKLSCNVYKPPLEGASHPQTGKRCPVSR